MIDRQEIKLQVDRQLRAARKVMPLRIGSAFDDLARQRGLLRDDPVSYFQTLGHPVFELPVWVAARLQDDGIEVPAEIVSEVLGVSAIGYLHTRAHDNWLDGPSRENPGLVVLAESMLTLCNRRLAGLVGSSERFWSHYSDVMNDYAESLLLTEELRRSGASISKPIFHQLLAQARPLVIPTAALLDYADRWQFCGDLEDFVRSAAVVSQLFNDLTDIFRDRRMGHRTWTAEAIGDASIDQVWTEVADPSTEPAGGLIDGLMKEALSYHELSADAVRRLAGAAAEVWLTNRREALRDLPGALHQNLISIFVSRMAGVAADPSTERA